MLTDASTWDDDSDELTLVVSVPVKYTTVSIRVLPDGDAISFTGSDNSRWTSSYDADECLWTYTFVVAWADISSYMTVFEDSGSYYYTGTLELTATETFNHDIDTSRTITRTLEEELVFIIGIESTVDLSVDLNVLIDAAATFHVFDALTVLEHDGTSSTITIGYQSEVNYPWVLDPSTYSFVDYGDYGIPYINEGTLTENNRGAGCSVSGQYCVQDWSVTFPVSAVCDILGNWTITHTATYESESENFDFSAVVSLDSVCATSFTNIEVDATLMPYTDNTFATATNEFYVGDTAFFRLDVNGLQTINSISLTSVDVVNLGNTYTLTDSTVLSFAVLNTATTQVDFSFYVDPTKVKGDETATVRANVEIDYIDRRRELRREGGEDRIFVVEEPRRLLLYIDSQNNVKVEHVISVKNHRHCIKDSEEIPLHTIDQSPCENLPSKSHIRQCTISGWTTLVNECDNSEQTDNLTSESLNTETTSSDSMWELIFFCLLAFLVLTLVAVGARKYCFGRNSKIVSSGSSGLPTKEVMLDTNNANETRC